MDELSKIRVLGYEDPSLAQGSFNDVFVVPARRNFNDGCYIVP
jgi:hypothetical protein